PTEGTGHRKDAWLLRERVPSLPERADSGTRNSYKERYSSPVLRRRLRVRDTICVTALVPKDYLVSGLGNINPYSLSVGQRTKTEHVFAFRQTSLASTDFFLSDPLDRLTHVQLLFTDPSPSFRSSGSHLSICLLSTHQYLHRGGSRRAHARHFNARLATLLLHFGVNLHEGTLP
ncbi:hypothetical protein JTE90_002050, partial [Oedothorax gibbosus]